jgi:hypothetical protein
VKPGEPEEATNPTPRSLTPTQVVAIVRSGHLEELLGVAESERVDFKGAAYDLDLRKDKRDLVADVASLANARGGVLVLGVGTTKRPAEQIEVADSLLGVRPAKVERDRYLKVIREHVVPLVKSVTVDLVTHTSDRHDFGLIEVEPQYDGDKPFVVNRIVDEEGIGVSTSFGWPERTGQDTYWHPLGRVQQLISAGLRVGLPSAEPPKDLASEELWAAESAAFIGGYTPSLVSQTIGLPDAEIPDFFDSVATELRGWHPLRAAGFGFDTSWHPPTPIGNRLVAADRGTSLVLSRWGVLTVAGSLDAGFFQWATQENVSYTVINPAALTEFVAEALRTAYEFVGPRLRPSGWSTLVLLSNLKGDRPVALNWPRQFPRDSLWPATIPEARIPIQGTGEWQKDAYTVLREIYGQCFGRGESHIFGGNAETKTVDIAAFDHMTI